MGKTVLPGTTKGKKSGTETSILFRNKHFLCGNGTTSSDNIYRTDRMSDFEHNVRWNDLHAMVFVHVPDYFLCDPMFIHPGCHE
jgi:hypothetical protein